MNRNRSIPVKIPEYRISYQDEDAVDKLHQHVITLFPHMPREYIVVCIGTDRSTGDSLGPLTGSLFTEKRPRHIKIYGTLHDPVHAVNLKDHLSKIAKNHRNPFIIAVDACLGKTAMIGSLITGTGPIQPGAALKKDLPRVGDIHITGVVNMSGFMEHATLQNTRLSIVMDMAQKIAALLDTLDQQLSASFIRPAVLNKNSPKKSLI